MSAQSFSSILKTRTRCRICGSHALTPVVSLGEQYIAGNFGGRAGEPAVQRRIALDLVRCDPSKDQEACGLVQLRHTVPPKILYHAYWYRSGINTTMRNHLSDISRLAKQSIQLQHDDVVVDIGCNDGTLLKSYQTPGIRLLGFDPATNIVAFAAESGVPVVNDFFTAQNLRTVFPHDKAKVITSIAMFYDLENPHDFVADVKEILQEDGIWILELSYLPSMLKANSFDTICHEHLEYYSLAPMERLLAEHGLQVLDVHLNNINGGSFQIVVGHEGKRRATPDAQDRIQSIRVREFELALDTDRPFAVFRRNISTIKKNILAFLKKAKRERKVVHGYGASTKGNTTLQYCEITTRLLPCIADRNKEKWGSYTVGTNIPIISEEESRRQRPDYYLVLPWHFIDEFKKREAAFLLRGGRFVLPMPEVHCVGNEAE